MGRHAWLWLNNYKIELDYPHAHHYYTGSTFIMSRVDVKGRLPVYVWQQQPEVQCEKLFFLKMYSCELKKCYISQDGSLSPLSIRSYRLCLFLLFFTRLRFSRIFIEKHKWVLKLYLKQHIIFLLLLLFMSQSHCNRDRVHFVVIDVFVGVMVIKLLTIRQNEVNHGSHAGSGSDEVRLFCEGVLIPKSHSGMHDHSVFSKNRSMSSSPLKGQSKVFRASRENSFEEFWPQPALDAR